MSILNGVRGTPFCERIVCKIVALIFVLMRQGR